MRFYLHVYVQRHSYCAVYRNGNKGMGRALWEWYRNGNKSQNLERRNENVKNHSRSFLLQTAITAQMLYTVREGFDAAAADVLVILWFQSTIIQSIRWDAGWKVGQQSHTVVCPMSVRHTDICCGIMHAALSISWSRCVAERDDGRICCCARWHRRRSVIGRSPSVRLRPPSRAVDRRSRVEKDRRTACRSIPLHFWTGKTRSGGGSERASSNEARMARR